MASSISSAIYLPFSSSYPIWMMRINIPNNKRHFVVAEEVHDRCVVTSAATATWRNVDVVVGNWAL